MEKLDDKISNLSVMEQGLQHLANQKKSFQNQLVEVESALNELGSDASFKIIGNFMFKRDASDLKKELIEKKDVLNLRIKYFEKEEEKAGAKFKELQDEVLKELSAKK